MNKSLTISHPAKMKKINLLSKEHFKEAKEKEKLKASKAIATYTSTVGMAVAADGALPVGDVIGLGIIVFTMYALYYRISNKL